MTEQKPTAWLLNRLCAILSADASLLTGYKAQQARYSRSCKLTQARRELALYERLVNEVDPSRRPSYERKIERRKATIARLESEL